MNPAALMIYMGAIANGGKAAEPYLILRTESALGLPSLPHFTTRTGTLISGRYGGCAGGPDGQQRDPDLRRQPLSQYGHLRQVRHR